MFKDTLKYLKKLLPVSVKKWLIDFKLFLEDFWNFDHGRYKLPAPSVAEKVIIKDLRLRARSLKSLAAGRSWEDFVRKLKNRFLYLDPRNFLRWGVIQLTMTMIDTPPEVLEEMNQSPDWDHFWSPALQENAFGNPVPHPNLKRSSGTLVIHAWHLFNLKKNTDIDLTALDVIVEFGGGYGSMCRLLRNLGFKGIYVIYDLPEFSLLQDFYLRGIGLETVVYQGEKPVRGQNILVSGMERFEDLKALLPDGKKLFIATWSISETPLESRQRFLNLIVNYDYYLIAFQEKFDGIDNTAFFRSYRAENNRIKWLSYLSYPRDNADYYLIGSKK